LTYKASRYRGGIGTLSGRLDGYRVLVDPDEQRKISLYFEKRPRVHLRNYAQNQRPPADLSRLYSGDKRFDAYFKTRYASESVSQRIQAHKAWAPLIAMLETEFRRSLAQLNVSETGVTMVLDFGNPPHIPAGAVERLLRLSVSFAKVIEPSQSGEPLSTPLAPDKSLV
jgi:hypothetical protein